MESRLSCSRGKSMPATRSYCSRRSGKGTALRACPERSRRVPPGASKGAGFSPRGPALLVVFWVAACFVAIVPRAAASGDAPQWMHALVGATLPSYDEKTDAVLLYSETNVTVLSADKIRKHVREAYKILRPEGRERGTVGVYFSPSRKIISLHGLVHPRARQGLRG